MPFWLLVKPQTLKHLPIVKQYVRAGPTVVSDLWAAHNTHSLYGYKQLAVNNKFSYNARQHNSVELLCCCAKLGKKEWGTYRRPMDSYCEHIGRLVRISVSGYRGRRFEPRQQYVVSLSKILYLHCFSRLSCEISTRWGQPREGCSVL